MCVSLLVPSNYQPWASRTESWKSLRSGFFFFFFWGQIFDHEITFNKVHLILSPDKMLYLLIKLVMSQFRRHCGLSHIYSWKSWIWRVKQISFPLFSFFSPLFSIRLEGVRLPSQVEEEQPWEQPESLVSSSQCPLDSSRSTYRALGLSWESLEKSRDDMAQLFLLQPVSP